MTRAPQRSRELFESGFYCAESVLMAMAEEMGIQSDLIPRIASGFCSGMSRTCGMCGAVSGAILGINLASGRSEPGAPLDRTYALVLKFRTLFEEKFGSIECYELTGCDLGSDQGQDAFRKNQVLELCLRYTEEATAMALMVLEDTD